MIVVPSDTPHDAIRACDVPDKFREFCMAHYGQPTEPAWVYPKCCEFRWFDQTFVTEDGETWKETTPC